MPRLTMESFMKTGMSALHLGQPRRSVREGGMATSLSQARHLKCIIEVMKPLIVILLLAISVQAQSIADAARKERERQANLRPAKVFKSTENPAPAATPAAPVKVETPAAPDPVKAWNDKMDELRKKLQTLTDQETALRLRIGELSNQLFATVIDPGTQARVQSELGQANQQLVTVTADLDQTKKAIDAMQLAGPPKPIETPKAPEPVLRNPQSPPLR